MDQGIQFYEDKFNGDLSGLEYLANDSTTHITIPTPEDWKCDREGCLIDYYHGHDTFTCLKNNMSLKPIEKLHFGKSTTGVTISETELQKIEKINELIEAINNIQQVVSEIASSHSDI